MKIRVLWRFLFKMRVLCGYIDLNTRICGSTRIYAGIVATLLELPKLRLPKLFRQSNSLSESTLDVLPKMCRISLDLTKICSFFPEAMSWRRKPQSRKKRLENVNERMCVVLCGHCPNLVLFMFGICYEWTSSMTTVGVWFPVLNLTLVITFWKVKDRVFFSPDSGTLGEIWGWQEGWITLYVPWQMRNR